YVPTPKAIGVASIRPEASNRAASSTLEAELLADHTTKHCPDRHASPSPLRVPAAGKLGAKVIVELETMPRGETRRTWIAPAVLQATTKSAPSNATSGP